MILVKVRPHETFGSERGKKEEGGLSRVKKGKEIERRKKKERKKSR